MKNKHVSVTGVAVLGAMLCFGAAAWAKPWWARGSNANDGDFLPPDAAFRVSSSTEGRNIHVHWNIADGYYLYKQKIEILAESPDLVLSPPALPHGTVKNDPYLGTQEIYTQQLDATATYMRSDAGAHPLQIKVTYQGCAEAGLCYLPITHVLFPTAGAALGSAAPPSGKSLHKGLIFERVAILGGLLAFLIAGFTLGKGRVLTPPP